MHAYSQSLPRSTGDAEKIKQATEIAIIGAGYAGLAAAVTLAANNFPVTLIESAKQLGGRARGVWHNDTQLDNGQHILLGCYHTMLKLIEQVGGNPSLDFQRLPLQLTLHNCFELKAPRLPAPLHLLFGFMFAKGLSYAARIRAAQFMFYARQIKFTLPQDMSVLALMQAHHQSEELIRLMWEPICISALNTPISKASAQTLLNVLRDSLNGTRADSDMLLPRLDFSALFPDRAAKYIIRHGGEVLRSCTVESTIKKDGLFELQTTQGTMQFKQVICASSASSTARLFGKLPELEQLTQQIAAIPYQPIYTIYLQYPATVQLPHPMMGFDRSISQWLFDKGQISNQFGLIAVVISAEGIHQELSQEQLAHKVVQELHDQLGIQERPIWHKVIAEKRATFSCEVNLSRPSHTTPINNLLLAGDFTQGDYPATLEGAVMSGIRCAQAILEARQ
jgi:hydroxysqualene dehydroxylase